MSAAIHLSHKDSKQLHACQHYYLDCIFAGVELLKKMVQPTAMHRARQAISLLT